MASFFDDAPLRLAHRIRYRLWFRCGQRIELDRVLEGYASPAQHDQSRRRAQYLKPPTHYVV